MAQQRPIPWMPLLGALVLGVALAGVVAWWLNLQSLEDQIKETRAALKKARLSGSIPPNQDVMDYLNSRQTALEGRYQHWLELIAAPPLAEAASADAQLYFQEQFHEVQRTLERLAAARALAVPEQLGFPKELPPSDTVPRLLVQLSLIREAAQLILEQGVAALSSFKVEDPEAVPEEESSEPFLTRLPVRVRLTSSLPALMKILGAIERVRPLIEVRAIRVLSAPPPNVSVGGAAVPSAAPAGESPGVSGPLEVELMLARYLITSASQEPPAAETAHRAAPKKGAARSIPRAPRQSPASSSKADDE